MSWCAESWEYGREVKISRLRDVDGERERELDPKDVRRSLNSYLLAPAMTLR
jgi:hypothetical protein